MYNKSKVIQALNGLVGWEQPFNPALPVLNAANLTATSGRLFNESPYVKLDYIKDTQDYIDISDTDFNTLLQNKQNTAITNIIDSIFNDSDYIDRQVLYQFANNKKTLETNAGFVGFEIDISSKKNVAFEISRTILEFQGTGDVKLLLFNSAKSEPIFSKVVTITSSLQEEELNWRVDNSEIFYKGKFYFGYIANGLTVTPYKRDYQASDIKSVITHLNVNEVTVPDHTTETLFDLDNIDSSDNTFGLNPDIIIFDDFTDLIVNNKQLFSKAIQLQGQIDVVKGYIASLRSNRNERNVDEKVNRLLLELEGAETDSMKVVGLRTKLKGQISSIGKEIKRLKNGYFANGFLLNTLS